MIKWFANLKIGFRIIIGFLIIVMISAIIGGIGIYSLRDMNASYNVAYTDTAAALEYMERISSSFQRIRMNLYGQILAETKQDKEFHAERVNVFKALIDENIGKYRDLLSSYKSEDVKVELELIDETQAALTEFGNKRTELLSDIAMDVNRRSEAFALLSEGGELRARATTVDDAIMNLINYNTAYAAEQITYNQEKAASSTVIIAVGIVIGIFLSIIIGLFISRNISKRIGILVDAADKLAVGDIEVNVQADTKDEIGVLAESFRRMIANTRQQALAAERIADGDMTIDIDVKSEKDLLNKKLFEIVDKNNEVLGNVVSASEQVASGAKQVSDSSMALSQGAAEQASSIEELTASLEEISSQTKLNAENANQANRLAETAKKDAIQGNDQMKEMLKAMEEINVSSSNISKIIKVIDEIAFQTNILALNAAVEAARAGQHGKGFAVVAEEVRNLAARSANAAKETTEMIEGSIKKTEGGTKIAKDTAEALEKIVHEIEKVANLIGDIAIASDEQATGVGQINQGIMQVSQVVQTNSATSEESAAASEELSSQAELLQDMVGRFKLKHSARTNKKAAALNPEILKMLEAMTEKKRLVSATGTALKIDDEKELKPRIALSDSEFGKY